MKCWIGVATALAIVSVGPVAPAGAQSIATMLETDIRNAGGDAWDVWTSPLRAQPNDWLALAGVVALSAAVSPWDDDVDRWAVRHQDDTQFRALKPLRAGGVAFSGRTITPVALGALALSLATRSESMQEGLFGCATAYGASSVVRTFVVYPLVERTRPDPRSPTGPPPAARAGDQYHFAFPGTSDWGGHSLPGGHIANVVACTEFLTSRFAMGIAEPAIWALAGGITLSRTLDRGHWTSDEVLGAALGYAVGREIALRAKRRAGHERTKQDANVSGMFVAPGRNGMRLGWARAF